MIWTSDYHKIAIELFNRPKIDSIEKFRSWQLFHGVHLANKLKHGCIQIKKSSFVCNKFVDFVVANAFVILFWWTYSMQYRFSQEASDTRTSLPWEGSEEGNIFYFFWVQWEKSHQLKSTLFILQTDAEDSLALHFCMRKIWGPKKSASLPQIVNVIPVVLYTTLVLSEYIFVWINWLEPNNWFQLNNFCSIPYKIPWKYVIKIQCRKCSFEWNLNHFIYWKLSRICGK